MTRTGSLATALLSMAAIAGCHGAPTAPARTSPAEAGPPPGSPGAPAVDPRLRTLAGILRAEDRRLTDDALLTGLSSDDDGVRTRAVAAVARIADRDARTRLEHALGDPAAVVRAEAAFGLGVLADVAALPAVRALATDPDPSVRSAVAEALGRMPSQDSADALRALLGDADAGVRTDACLAAWKLPDASFAVDGLAENTRFADPLVRFGAAYALARLGSAALVAPSAGATPSRLAAADVRRVRDALAAMVRAPEAEIRMQVARGLTVPSTPVEVSVIAALSVAPEPGVRVNAVRAFAFQGAPLDPVLRRGLTDKDEKVVRAAIEALAKVGGEEAVRTLTDGLLKLAENRNWVREGALLSLAQIAPEMAPGLATGMLESSDPNIRAAIPLVLTGRRDRPSLDMIARLLADPVPAVQAAAIPALAAGEDPLPDALRPVLEAPDPVVRSAVAEAVGGRWPRTKAPDRTALWDLLENLWRAAAGDAMPDARLAIVDAAAAAGAVPEAHAALERASGDGDWLVRRRAVQRLSEVFQEDRSGRLGPATDLPLDHYVKILRWAERPRAAIVTVQRSGFKAGRFTLELDAKNAPLASWNFAELAARRFYDGSVVHRVVPNFVVQDGDPRGDGYGGPGYAIRDEYGRTRFLAGILGMAADGKDTAGSQWFVTLSGQPHLDGRYTVFGRVVQNFAGVVLQILPGDRIVSIAVYEGDGTEPLPAM